MHNEPESKLFDVLDKSQNPTLTFRRVTKKRKTVSCVGRAIEHKPYHLTLLKSSSAPLSGLSRHHFIVPTQPQNWCTASLSKVR